MPRLVRDNTRIAGLLRCLLYTHVLFLDADGQHRPGDVPRLVEWFSEGFCRDNGIRPKRFAPGAIDALERQSWRGNLRVLRNVVEGLLILVPRDTIGADDVPAALGAPPPAPAGTPSLPLEAPTLREFQDRAERLYIVSRLREHDWNVAATAKAIDTPRSNLYKKLEADSISRETDG